MSMELPMKRGGTVSQPVGLTHGVVTRVGTARVAVGFLSNPDVDGQPVHVELSVVPYRGEEFTANLRIGERFSTGDSSWVFTRVDNLGSYDYVVWLAPVPGSAEPSGQPATEFDTGRAERIARILEFVQFEPRLDDAVVDKVAQAALHSRLLHEPPARIAEAVAAARHSTVRLTSLVPGLRFGETEFRDFLGRLAARLDAARPWPQWRYERVDAAEWNPARVQPLASIDLPPLRLGNLLSVPFERVERDGMTMDLAVLRLAAGPTVALASEVGSRSGGTVVLQHPGDSVRADVAEILQASGIGPDRIRWLGP
jgi:Family of unknown function (DUF6406)